MSEPTPGLASTRAKLLVALNSTEGVDRSLICRLSSCDRWLERGGQGSPETGRAISRSALESVRERLRRFEEAAEAQQARAFELGAAITTRVDPGYPAPLLDLPQPPPVLYHRGRLVSDTAIAIVGSRNADGYGLETASMFAMYLADRGVVVVSGLAVGIDSAAHRGALDASSGRTIAVLGSGIDVEYPRGSARLADRIAVAGAVVSEFPLGTRPLRHHFPMRNRIIAALGSGTFVVRATARSGSLITARLALELGRDVYALPGNVFDPRSIGPNSLIRDGALPVQHPREILESLPLRLRDQLEPAEAASSTRSAPAGQHLKEVYALLPEGDERTAEALSQESGLTVATVLAALMELELGGWVRRYPGPTYCRPSGRRGSRACASTLR